MKNFSQIYYGDLLTEHQHKVNNEWFEEKINKLIPNHPNSNLYIPELNKFFNSNGEEVKFDYVIGMGV